MKLINHKQKSILWVCTAFTLTAALSSCKKQLDLNPTTQIASNEFWTSASNVDLAVAALYRGGIQYISTDAEYSPTDWWSYNGMTFLEFATDNAYDRRGDNSAFNQLTNGALTANNANLGLYWSFSYARIAQCNFFLENINRATLPDATKKRVIAEARFLRATQFFYLSSYFGSVPLTTHTLSLDSANNVDKATQKAVQDFTETELIAAAADLPSQASVPATQKGRTNKQTALAFLGRLYLFEKNWQKAADTYNQIIGMNENVIDPKYSSLFDGSNESSREILFATQYLINLGSNAMNIHFQPRMNGGFSIFCPLGSLAESYDFTDGTPFSYSSPKFDPNDEGANRDPRFKANFLYNKALFKGKAYSSHPDSTTAYDRTTTNLQATRTGFCMRKFISESVLDGALANSGTDLPIIRYAEVLLGYLEARIMLGSVNQALLDATINKVRGRASVNMPPVTELDPAKLLPILKKERRIELAFEGIRLWDLYRWDDAATVLQGYFYGASFPGAKSLRKAPNNSTDPNSRWYVTTKAFNKATNYPWPVPQGEVNINPKLK